MHTQAMAQGHHHHQAHIAYTILITLLRYYIHTSRATLTISTFIGQQVQDGMILLHDFATKI